MSDLITWVALLVFWAMLFAVHLRDSRRALRVVQAAQQAAAVPPPSAALCGCNHHLAFHDRENSRCHAMVEVAVKFQEIPSKTGITRLPLEYKERQCACRRYIGPEPLPTIYAE